MFIKLATCALADFIHSCFLTFFCTVLPFPFATPPLLPKKKSYINFEWSLSMTGRACTTSRAHTDWKQYCCRWECQLVKCSLEVKWIKRWSKRTVRTRALRNIDQLLSVSVKNDASMVLLFSLTTVTRAKSNYADLCYLGWRYTVAI